VCGANEKLILGTAGGNTELYSLLGIGEGPLGDKFNSARRHGLACLLIAFGRLVF
jgi:hypothetical protein